METMIANLRSFTPSAADSKAKQITASWSEQDKTCAEAEQKSERWKRRKQIIRVVPRDSSVATIEVKKRKHVDSQVSDRPLDEVVDFFPRQLGRKRQKLDKQVAERLLRQHVLSALVQNQKRDKKIELFKESKKSEAKSVLRNVT